MSQRREVLWEQVRILCQEELTSEDVFMVNDDGPAAEEGVDRGNAIPQAPPGELRGNAHRPASMLRTLQPA